jgi:hydrogenase expression/formation protein HypC
MCLAVPARITERAGDEAVVDLQGSSLRVSAILTPEAKCGDWVLVHAGFAITQLDEEDARQTWDYLRQAFPDLSVEERPPAPTAADLPPGGGP